MIASCHRLPQKKILQAPEKNQQTSEFSDLDTESFPPKIIITIHLPKYRIPYKALMCSKVIVSAKN